MKKRDERNKLTVRLKDNLIGIFIFTYIFYVVN